MDSCILEGATVRTEARPEERCQSTWPRLIERTRTGVSVCVRGQTIECRGKEERVKGGKERTNNGRSKHPGCQL
jgi:hypothetical protein